MLSCTAALHVLKACANMQNMHTAHHFAPACKLHKISQMELTKIMHVLKQKCM